jgi:hypothetical protein
MFGSTRARAVEGRRQSNRLLDTSERENPSKMPRIPAVLESQQREWGSFRCKSGSATKDGCTISFGIFARPAA